MSIRFSGTRLRSRRHDKGFSREEFARRVGVKPVTIGSYESGFTTPSARALVAMAEALGCTPSVFYDHGRDPVSPYWPGVCAALPPLIDNETVAVGDLLARIERRRDADGCAAA
jgi:transcriptional regulator with XRE-family HTH domain